MSYKGACLGAQVMSPLSSEFTALVSWRRPRCNPPLRVQSKSLQITSWLFKLVNPLLYEYIKISFQFSHKTSYTEYVAVIYVITISLITCMNSTLHDRIYV